MPGGVVRVGDADIAAIASHLALTEAACRSRFVAPGGDRLVDGPSHACVFLLDGAETSCAIYPVRPERCRTWPFWPELLADPEVLRRAAARCPGIQLDPELAEG